VTFATVSFVNETFVAKAIMAGSQQGVRLVRSMCRFSLPSRATQPCARRLASTAAEQVSPGKGEDDLADLDSSSSFSSPVPDAKMVEEFDQSRGQNGRERRLPGNRFVRFG
jgi:large subunit ribosomal protein L5